MLSGKKSDNSRETQHQVVENLDNLREVILERQKSRLLKKLIIQTTLLTLSLPYMTEISVVICHVT